MPRVGPAAKAPSISRWPCLDQPVERVHQLGRTRRHHGVGAVLLAGAEQRSEPGGVLARATSVERTIPAAGTLRDRLGEKAFGGGNGKQGGDGVRAGALAEDRHVVGVAAEHRDVVAHPAQRHHQVAQEQVVVEGDVVVGQR